MAVRLEADEVALVVKVLRQAVTDRTAEFVVKEHADPDKAAMQLLWETEVLERVAALMDPVPVLHQPEVQP